MVANTKKFAWEVTSQPKPGRHGLHAQEQCSSGGGGNGKCGAGRK